LNLRDADQVCDAFDQIRKSVIAHDVESHFQGVTVQKMIGDEGYELILGGTRDTQFGPVLMFGAGGQLVETFRDSAVALPPLNATLARRLMEQTRIYKALLGTRGRPPVDLDELKRTLIALSHLLVEQPWIKECDINPLLASPEGIVALDARVVLHEPSTEVAALTPPAIRPYPLQYVEQVVLKDSTAVTLRPIRLEDEPMMVRFHESLSDESVRRRYFQVLHLRERVDHERLIRICFNDFDREVALVAEHRGADGGHQVLGVGRLSRDSGTSNAEFAMLIVDPWQGRGLGHLLLDKLIRVGFDEGIHRIVGSILPDNWPMQALCQSLGFNLRHTVDEVRARLDLQSITGEQRAEAAAVVDEARRALGQ
jgi:acetyltransferase